ncbi:hemerythrin domain-containing protein [Tepidibacillus sp. HK-1]|uniref:hemerythrin domain-containing protein n=1 Tax=Tepidibacillus sp. HK-1 TaxID=1883407 RepID=UPI00085337F6|nr:hemerythrin domain-containing protein [Tepidibacillus sp. HK-1]GBF11241.1 iron-sulfur cluster repair protein YtfE [Tepidibacillus sp. HK-1]
MNSLLQLFYEDHEHALMQLDQLHVHLEELRKGAEIERVKLQLIGFTKFLEVALDIHFVQEEQALFPLMAEKIGPNGPIMVMEREHDDLRNAQKALKKELMKEIPAKDAALKHAGLILQVLREHIHKENQILFPLSERILSLDEWKTAERIAGNIALGIKE